MNIHTPAAKMTYMGSGALSNAELLSLVLRTGTKDKTAVELAEAVLDYTMEHIGELGAAEVHELSGVYGIGEAKACSIIAAIELSKRLAAEKAAKQLNRIRGPEQLAEMLMAELLYETQEHFVAIYLNTKLDMIFRKTIGIGTMESAVIHPRDVLAPAIKRGAAAIIVAHQHPSGDPTPSAPDISLTKMLRDASELVGVKLLDHLILGAGRFISLKEEGYL